jgi:glutamine synthetase
VPAAARRSGDRVVLDDVLRDALGPEIVDTFLAVKRFEVGRHRAWVSDWELDEYLHHL